MNSNVSPKNLNPFEVRETTQGQGMDKISEENDLMDDDREKSSSSSLDRNESAMTFELPLVSVNRKGTIKQGIKTLDDSDVMDDEFDPSMM